MSVHNLPIHTAADMLPRLVDDELSELAADISANGQLDPVVIWSDENGKRWILDGRNRMSACEIVEVVPRTVEFSHQQIDDPFAYVRSKNLRRRNLRAYQTSVGWYLLGGGDNYLSVREAANAVGPSRETMRMAKIVVERDRRLAIRVLNAKIPLRIAYDQVMRKNNAQDEGTATNRFESSNKYPSPKTGLPGKYSVNKIVKRDENRHSAASREGRGTQSSPKENHIAQSDSHEGNYKIVVESCSELASIDDPYTLVQRYGDPQGWPNFTEAKRLMNELEDSVTDV